MEVVSNQMRVSSRVKNVMLTMTADSSLSAAKEAMLGRHRGTYLANSEEAIDTAGGHQERNEGQR